MCSIGVRAAHVLLWITYILCLLDANIQWLYWLQQAKAGLELTWKVTNISTVTSKIKQFRCLCKHRAKLQYLIYIDNIQRMNMFSKPSIIWKIAKNQSCCKRIKKRSYCGSLYGHVSTVQKQQHLQWMVGRQGKRRRGWSRKMWLDNMKDGHS